MHRLVSRVRREELPLKSRAEWVNEVCQRMGDWFQKVREEFTRLEEYKAEADHVRAWKKHAEQYAPWHSPKLLCKLDERSRCLELPEKALAIRQELLGEEHPETARSSLAIPRKLLVEKHPETAKSYDSAATTYSKLGEHRRDTEYVERALKIWINRLGQEHPDTLQGVLNQATTLFNLNRKFETKQFLDTWLQKIPKGNSKYAELEQMRNECAQALPGVHKPKKPHKKKRR